MCLKLGLNLKDVLPPFGIAFQASSNLMYSQNDSKLEAEQFCKTHEVQHVIEHQQNVKNDCHSLSHAEGYKLVTNKHIPSSYEYEGEDINVSESADTFTLPTSIHDVQKKVMKDKQDRRGRKKCKKRSILVDILIEFRQCTLEEIYRIDKFSYVDQAVTQQGCQNSFRKGGNSEDHEAANDGDVTEKGGIGAKVHAQWM